jgi:hypothetical protein
MRHDLLSELSHEIKKYERKLLKLDGFGAEEDLVDVEQGSAKLEYVRLKYFVLGMKQATSIVADYLWEIESEKTSI